MIYQIANLVDTDADSCYAMARPDLKSPIGQEVYELINYNYTAFEAPPDTPSDVKNSPKWFINRINVQYSIRRWANCLIDYF